MCRFLITVAGGQVHPPKLEKGEAERAFHVLSLSILSGGRAGFNNGINADIAGFGP